MCHSVLTCVKTIVTKLGKIVTTVKTNVNATCHHDAQTTSTKFSFHMRRWHRNFPMQQLLRPYVVRGSFSHKHKNLPRTNTFNWQAVNFAEDCSAFNRTAITTLVTIVVKLQTMNMEAVLLASKNRANWQGRCSFVSLWCSLSLP